MKSRERSRITSRTGLEENGAELGYLNIFSDDIAKLAGFYADLFGLEEIVASREEIDRLEHP